MTYVAPNSVQARDIAEIRHSVTTAVAIQTLRIYEEMDMVGHRRRPWRRAVDWHGDDGRQGIAHAVRFGTWSRPDRRWPCAQTRFDHAVHRRPPSRSRRR